MRAAQLRWAANTLAERAIELGLSNKVDIRSWEALFSTMNGPAPQAARKSLDSLVDYRQAQERRVGAVAAVLARYAQMQSIVEELQELVESGDAAGLPEFAVGHLAGQLSGLGDVLDRMCAAEIEALCTPADPPPPVPVGEAVGVTMPELHARNSADAPPAIARLLADNPDVHLLEAPNGRLVALVNHPDVDIATLENVGTSPATVTTYVPGVHSSDIGSWQAHIDNARSLTRATGGPAVAWLGYEAPSGVHKALHRQPARDGARELVRFQEGIGKRWPGAQKIVVAYSYGTVVAGYAARELAADDVVLVGSPGAGQTVASDFRGRVWAATNDDDPITWVTGPTGGAHGIEPTAPEFGARALPGFSGADGGHRGYWWDPEFFAGIGQVVRE